MFRLPATLIPVLSRRIRAVPIVESRVVISAPRAEVLLIGAATVAFATALVAALLFTA